MQAVAILALKRALVSGSTSTTVTFSGPEFQQATGFARIRGPFALQINILPGSLYPLFVGLTITTEEGAVSVSDRRYIAYVTDNNTITITGNTVPSLSSIRGIVTSIVITFYTPPGTIFDVPNTCPEVSLRLEPEKPIVSAPPLIGIDRRAEISTYELYTRIQKVSVISAATHLATQRWLYTCPDNKRAEIEYVHLEFNEAIATAVVSAICFVRITISGVQATFALLTSLNSVSYRSADIPCHPVTLYPTDTLEGMTTNASANNLGFVSLAIIREYYST